MDFILVFGNKAMQFEDLIFTYKCAQCAEEWIFGG